MAEESKKNAGLEGPERLLGTRIVDFELVSVLGSGGMSVVYRARHPVTQQEVAIKILPPELAVHDELKARFVEEARVLALLEHPNIVALNNFVDTGPRLCLVMQFAEGVTFEQLIKQAKHVPSEEVLHVGIQVLKALEYAHGRQVIHRDIKPSNIIVRADRSVKVTDFGIAKILGQSRLTSTGQTMGTVRYMSPEQVRGKTVDARSDLYSLAVTLFEGLAGNTPFDGENQFDIMQRHLNDKVPKLETFGVSVALGVERLLLRALEKDPKNRYADATDFRIAMEIELGIQRTSLQKGLSGSRPIKLTKGRRAFAAAGLGVLVALAGAGALFGLKIVKPPHTELTPIPVKPHAETPPPRSAPSRVWLSPHEVPGLTLAVDKTFSPTADAFGVRVQSVRRRSDAELAALRDAVEKIAGSLSGFLEGSQLDAAHLARANGPQAIAHPAPLNLVVVPQAILNAPDRWPGYNISPDSTYPSRYVDARRTLFIADTPDFVRRELPYGVALHVLMPIAALSDSDLTALAEKFADWSSERAP